MICRRHNYVATSKKLSVDHEIPKKSCITVICWVSSIGMLGKEDRGKMGTQDGERERERGLLVLAG
jgi:hypothetical protein